MGVFFEKYGLGFGWKEGLSKYMALKGPRIDSVALRAIR